MERGTMQCEKHGDTLRQDVITGRILCPACAAEYEIRLARAIAKSGH